ncbi:MAG: AAA family ATPase [Spirulinaceae cyanobacterium]
MSSFSFWSKDEEKSPYHRKKGLLGNGWRPLEREFNWDFFWHLVTNDGEKLVEATLDITSDLANALGRNEYAWWANVLNLFGEDIRYEVDEFWEYITPETLNPNSRTTKEVIKVESPVTQEVSRDRIPLDYLLKRLQEITIFRLVDFLGVPDLITQNYQQRCFYYPPSRFQSWEQLEIIGVLHAYWSKHQVWLEINITERGKKNYTLMADNLTPLVNKATYNLAVMLSGYQSRVGQVNSQYAISSFPGEIQSFSDVVQQAILDCPQLAVLVHGKPGTGKTAWTQAVAKEILMPLGYVIFILDHDAIENFVPPSYLERICIIVNEADNLAQDRTSEIAQRSNKTEHILSLLDGTLYQSVIDEEGTKSQQKLVVLLTCNTTERLDPALLRKGRIDLISEFTHKFV